MRKKLGMDSPIRSSLRSMKEGDVLRFPIARLSVVRSTASTLGTELGRKYSTLISQKDKCIEVFRVK